MSIEAISNGRGGGRLSVILVVLLAAGIAIPKAAWATSVSGEQDVTGARPYDTVTGGTDATTELCSRVRRPHAEPAVAVDPGNANVIASASGNDQCSYAGLPKFQSNSLYRSWDGGHSWRVTLIPGYPGDNSPQGLTSPLSGEGAYRSDSWLAWDTHGYLYSTSLAFNPGIPQYDEVYVSTFGPSASGVPGADYLRTTVVSHGESISANGISPDKPAVTVDNTGGPFDGTLYATWASFTGNEKFNDPVAEYVAVSHDHGATFSTPVKVSQDVRLNIGGEVAIAGDGTAMLTWRAQTAGQPGVSAIYGSRSTDGGASWSQPVQLFTITPYDTLDEHTSVDTDSTFATEFVCGDGASTCKSGYTFSPNITLPQIAADAHGFHLVWDAVENPHPTGTSFSPGGLARVYYSHSSDGIAWSAPIVVDQNDGMGHQTMATVAAGGGYVTVGWYDSRHDACFSQERPIGNCPDGHAPPGGSLDVYVKRLDVTTGTWDPAATRVTTVTQNPNLETQTAGGTAFVGDYISASYGAGSTRIAWTDNRDVPPQPTTDDGNDVLGDPLSGGPCTTALTDPCWDQTLGKYKNIWIAAIN